MLKTKPFISCQILNLTVIFNAYRLYRLNMGWISNFKQSAESGDLTVGIIGLGYVGLPTAIGFHHAVVQAASARRAEGAGRRANACLQRFAPLCAGELEVVDADGGGGRFIGGRGECRRTGQSEREGEDGGASDHDGSPWMMSWSRRPVLMSGIHDYMS